MSQPPSEGTRGGAGRDPAGSGTGSDQNRRLAVLGLGQIGGSLALAGKAAGLFNEVVGFGHREESLRRAQALGLCDRTTTSAADAVVGAGTVVLATPLRSIRAVVDAMVPTLPPDALVIDVGSVKGTQVRDIESRLPTTVTFVGCHPLAGTERFGPDAASADLFKGCRCILCPTARTSTAALARARTLWEALGANVVTMTADLHDRLLATVSHLPHVAAYALAAALGSLPEELEQAARELPTASLRDTSRIAASSPAMWRDIFLENRAALLPLIDALAARLAEIRDAVAADDGVRIAALLDAARANRAKILPA